MRQSRNDEPTGGALVQIEAANVSVCWVTQEEAEQIKRNYQHAQAVEDLKAAYIKILQRTDFKSLFDGFEELSGVFLPCPAESYFESSPRVMIVGQQTKGWRNKLCNLRNKRVVDDAGILASMYHTQTFARRGAKQSAFMQFYRKASGRFCPGARDAAIWSNQFCLSYKSGSPTELPTDAFKTVATLSYDLLKAQIEILQPDVVIFTTGPDRDKYIKECFPEYETVEILEPRRLWHFRVGGIHCFRISHPRWVAGTKYLNKAIELAKAHA